eukprot:13255038-Alexandrium_andersonii.AAC.1
MPNFCRAPSNETYSCMSTILNSTPRSLLTMIGRVPARKRHLANARLTSERLRLRQGSSSTPWHRQQMHVSTYSFPSPSAGVDGAPTSIMTSPQQS